MVGHRWPLYTLAWLAVQSGFTQAINGDSACVSDMCITATVNGTIVEYVLQSKGVDVGWMAIGFGTQMSDSEMVIVWPNPDGTATISQREAPGHVMPTIDREVMHPASLSSSSTSLQGSQPQIAFTIPATSDTRVPLIWAFARTSPGDPSRAASIRKHDTMGALTFDLSGQLTPDPGSGSGSDSGSGSSSGSGSGSSGGGMAGASGPLKSHEKLFVAHAVLVGLGFLLVLPLGSLFARWLRTYTSKWYLGHWMFQFTIAGPLILIGVALGIAGINKGGYPHLNDPHKKLGIALLVLYFVQSTLGAIIHWFKPHRPGRPVQNYAHAVLGLLIIALSFYEVRLGYKGEWTKATMRRVPGSVDKLFTVWAVIFPILYSAGLLLLRRQYRQERGEAPGPGSKHPSSDHEKLPSSAGLVGDSHPHHGSSLATGEYSPSSQDDYPTTHTTEAYYGERQPRTASPPPFSARSYQAGRTDNHQSAEWSAHTPSTAYHNPAPHDPAVPYHMPTAARYEGSAPGLSPSYQGGSAAPQTVTNDQPPGPREDHPAAKYYTGGRRKPARDLPRLPPVVHHGVRQPGIPGGADPREVGEDGRYYRYFSGRDRDEYYDSMRLARSTELSEGH